MTTIALENYNRPTPKRWKAIGDLFLYSIPIMEGVFASMPDVSIKIWLIWGWAVLAALVKIGTKYLHDINEDEYEDRDEI